MDTTKYIGIPYKAKGRELDGLDCWGLVRLIYKDQYNIDLPSFVDNYEINDDLRIQELLHQYREGWEASETPQEGDVVLFRIFGNETHVGVVVDSTTFIHVREGSDCVLDSFTNTKWKNRVVGFYHYVANTGALLNAVPHPLKTARITELIVEGTTLEELYETLNKKHNIDPEISKTVTIMVNGAVVPRTNWSTTVLTRTDVVEYRAVPGKEAVKMIALIVVAVYAPYLVAQLGTVVPGLVMAGPGLTGMAALTLSGKIAAGAIIMAGSYLINAISPVRPPTTEDPGTADQMQLLSGGNNPYNPYGAIPVILGKLRITPPLGAKSFVTYPQERESYLNMLLVWGYGPLDIDYSTAKIGEVDWDEYQFNSSMPNGGRITFDRKTEPTNDQIKDFDQIYGSDVTQIGSGIELFGPPTTGQSSGGSGGVPISSPLVNGVTIQFDSVTGFIIPPNPLPDDTYYVSPA
jgi:sulfur carrier protein ThiS